MDGKNLRYGLNTDLSFTDADRAKNIRSVGEVAKLMVNAGTVILCYVFSQFRTDSKMARLLFEDNEFIETLVDNPLVIVESRD